MIKGIKVKTHYFKVKKIGESQGINDPDKIIEAAEWKSLSEIKMLEHVYTEDVEFLVNMIEKYSNVKSLG